MTLAKKLVNLGKKYKANKRIIIYDMGYLPITNKKDELIGVCYQESISNPKYPAPYEPEFVIGSEEYFYFSKVERLLLKRAGF